jgi:hypothetical protein
MWCSLAPSLGRRDLFINLRDVMFVDPAGLAVLAEIHDKSGAQFRTDTPLMKYFADEAMKIRPIRNGEEGA